MPEETQQINSSSNSTIILKSSTFSSLQLSPNDWLIPSTSTIICIYFYDIRRWSEYGIGENDEFLNCDQLISSLKHLLDYYPLLSGILTASDDNHHASVVSDENRGGILFVSTTVDLSFNDLPLDRIEGENQSILPSSLHLINDVDPTMTLFHVRHTRFSCGSVALGMSINHQIADAHSFFQLIHDWTKFYRDVTYQSDVCHQRSLLQPNREEIEMRQTTIADFNDRRSLAVQETSVASSAQEETIVKIFRFTAEELERMKSDATLHRLSDVAYVSTFEVLTAHLHRHVMLAREFLSPSSMTRIFGSSNTRPRLTQPSIPKTYFGNAIMFSYLEVGKDELIVDDHLGSTSSAIHKAIEQNTNDDIRTTLAWVSAQSNVAKIAPTFRLNETDFTISAWNKMGMYSNADFHPNVYPRRILLPPEIQFNGAAILLSTECLDSSIDVLLGLTITEMERLENNPGFRKYRLLA